MNNITLTHELCAEDRARLDRLAAALEALQPPTVKVDLPLKTIENPDPVQKKLAETLAKAGTVTGATETAQNAPKVETPTTDHPAEEKPTASEPTPKEDAKPASTVEEIRQKIIALVNAGKKPQVQAIITSYAATASQIPEDKRAEAMARLVELEKVTA